MKNNIYIQNICSDCLQYLVNNENYHTNEETERMIKTLMQWGKTKYYPSGLTDNTEPSFSHCKCDLCNGLAGDRFEYYFEQK